MVGRHRGLVFDWQLRVPIDGHDVVGEFSPSVQRDVARDAVLGNLLLCPHLAATNASDYARNGLCRPRRHRDVPGHDYVRSIDDRGEPHLCPP